MYGFGHVQSGPVQSYNLAFLVLGIITAAIGIGAYVQPRIVLFSSHLTLYLYSFFVFPDNPVRCKFLTPEEKVIAVEVFASVAFPPAPSSYSDFSDFAPINKDSKPKSSNSSRF
jgi:hypothetical protein